MDLRRSCCSLPRRSFLGITADALARAQQRPAAKPAILDAVPFQRYIEDFKGVFQEEVVNFIRSVAILWGKSGGRFGRGKGLRVFADAKEIAHVSDLKRVTGALA